MRICQEFICYKLVQILKCTLNINVWIVEQTNLVLTSMFPVAILVAPLIPSTKILLKVS